MRFYIILIFFLFGFNRFSLAADSISIFKKRKIVFSSVIISSSASSLVYLNKEWYQKYATTHFHTFDDHKEWLQIDKCGHSYSTYQATRLLLESSKWSGFTRKQQFVVSGIFSLSYMTTIEIMDGYSSGWGFSWSDMIANGFGIGMAMAQKALWNDQRIQLKFMYYPSLFSKYNQPLLGNNLRENILKDYNGQTYWLSINPSSFIGNQKHFPKWLNVAIGYGANGMVNAQNNSVLTYDQLGNQLVFNRYRQFYFSLDADLTRIKTKSKVVKTLFTFINCIKIPFPNVEFSEKKITFNPY